MKTLYIDPFTGIAGDMFSGALLNLGLIDNEKFIDTLNSLNLKGCFAATERILKNGIRAHKFSVQTPKGFEGPGGKFSGKTKKFIPLTTVKKVTSIKNREHGHEHRSFLEVLQIINNSKLPEEVKKLSCKIFTELGKAEAYIHDQSLDKVHFHEVGAADAIYDICAASLAILTLEVDRVVSRPVALGGGTVKTAHGILPVPAPATAKLLEGVPTLSGPAERELTTPTGAAILKTVCDEFSADVSGKIVATGYGAGTLNFTTHANVLKVSILESAVNDELENDSILSIKCNLDDMPGEQLSSLIPQLLELGALDVTVTPCMMKKGRQGFTVEVLCDTTEKQRITEHLLLHTTTFGIRYSEWSRLKLKRNFIELQTPFGKISAKAGYLGDKLVKVSPEYELCHEAASRANVPISQIYTAVQAASLPLLQKN